MERMNFGGMLRAVVGGGQQTPSTAAKTAVSRAVASQVFAPGMGTVECHCNAKMADAHWDEAKLSDGRVWDVAWHPSGNNLLASCSSDGKVKLWSSQEDEENWRCIETLEQVHQRTVRSLSWSPCGVHLACASFDATVSIWSRNLDSTDPLHFEMEMTSSLDGHENEVKGVAWSPDSRMIATCSRDKSVWIWERSEQCVDGAVEFECAGVLAAHTQDVKSVLWIPSTTASGGCRYMLLSCSYDDTIKVWAEAPKRKDDWRCVQSLSHHTSTVWRLSAQKGAAAPIIASVSADGGLALWGVTKTAAAEKDGEEEPARLSLLSSGSGYDTRALYAVDWAPPLLGLTDKLSNLVVCGGGDDVLTVVEVFAAADGQSIKSEVVYREERAHDSDINAISFCSRVDKKKKKRSRGEEDVVCARFATCSDDGSIRVWALEAQYIQTAAAEAADE